MPLKHHTETAYLLFLGLVICLSGIVVSLLPDFPSGLKYWVIPFTAATLYPIILMPTFRRNRADYEFRLLHWLPSVIFVSWLVLALLDPYWKWFHVMNMGSFFLWSLPFVAFGIAMSIFFSWHVLRRRVLRITVLSLILVFFTVCSVVAEFGGYNPRLQAGLFHLRLAPSFSPVILRLRALRRNEERRPVVSESSSSSAKNVPSGGVRSSTASSVIAEHTPFRLPKSGSESLGFLLATIAALYLGTLHLRSTERVS